ncbi:unnamed protein product [Paramecium sonneborni]|uniref:HSF-type DNA-binding domain-containing protein n=1 Tax=Paramecium sonneborni TaxID=65129 RepID=A0A8S1PBF4_9CILI|nr:unnamed protein product [Paramecium sonneborni]
MQESSDNFQDSQSQSSEQRQKGSVPSFLVRLFDIMENEDLKEIIGWNTEGNAFIVRNQQLLADKILPKYFKHKNYPSFLRQLNMYNFKKSKADDVNQKFEHKWFRRDGRALLTNIKRRNQEENDDKDEIPQIVDEIEQFKKAQKELKNEIQAIADSQKQLQIALQQIMQQNETLFQESQQLTQELSNMQSKNQQRFANYSNILTEIVQRLQQEQEEELRNRDINQPQITGEQKKANVIQIKQEQPSQQQQFLSQSQNNLSANSLQFLMNMSANKNAFNFQMFSQLKHQQMNMQMFQNGSTQQQQQSDVKKNEIKKENEQ